MRCLWAVIAVFFSQAVWARTPVEQDDSPSTEESSPYVPRLLGSNPGKGFAVAPATRVTGFGGQPGVTVGGRLGWLFHHRLLVGVEGHVLASPTVWHADDQQVLSMSYGGFFAEGILGAGRPVQGLIHGFWGFGEVHYRSSLDLAEISEVSAVMVAELQASLVWAPTSWMRIQAGPGFRVATGGELKGLSGTDFWAPYGELSVALGLF